MHELPGLIKPHHVSFSWRRPRSVFRPVSGDSAPFPFVCTPPTNVGSPVPPPRSLPRSLRIRAKDKIRVCLCHPSFPSVIMTTFLTGRLFFHCLGVPIQRSHRVARRLDALPERRNLFRRNHFAAAQNYDRHCSPSHPTLGTPSARSTSPYSVPGRYLSVPLCQAFPPPSQPAEAQCTRATG